MKQAKFPLLLAGPLTAPLLAPPNIPKQEKPLEDSR
jgi:hypothetical protein